MMSKALMILCGSSRAARRSAPSPSTRTPTRWEYGIYTESAGNYDWQDANQRVQSTNMTHFFDQMGFPPTST